MHGTVKSMLQIKKTFWQKRLFLLLFTLFFFFAVFELIVRLVWEEESPTRYGYPPELIVADQTRGYKYQPFFSGNFQGPLYKNITIFINAQGLRDIPHNYTTSTNKKRILGIGDSTTFGPGVLSEDTYLALLEKKLNKNKFNVEIVKAGFAGYEFEQEYQYYIDEGHKYNPDIVILGVFLNDPKPLNLTEVTTMMFPAQKKGIKSFVRNHFKSLLFVYLTLKNIGKPTVEEYNRAYFAKIYDFWQGETWEHYENLLLEFNSVLREKNITLVLVLFPSTHQFTSSTRYGKLPQEKMLNFSLENNLTFIDLLPALDQSNFLDYYLKNDAIHLNQKGNDLVAETVKT